MPGKIAVEAVHTVFLFVIGGATPATARGSGVLRVHHWEAVMKRNQFVLALFILLALILASPASSLAQNTATLSGVVTDPQGGSIKAARVTLISKSTGAERSTSSGDDGRYSFVSLAPGKYKVRVDGGSGFSVLQEDNLEITVGAEADFSPQLQLRGIVTTAQVRAETSAVEPTTTDESNTIAQQQINDTPINGRAFE